MTDYSPIFGIVPGVFTQTLGIPAPDLYRDPAEVFAGVNPPYTYVRGFFPKNATISSGTGLQTSKGATFANVTDGLSNTIAFAESAGRPFVYFKRKRVAGGNALTDTDPSSSATSRLNSGGWSRPASDIILFGATSDPQGVLGGSIPFNTTNGHNIRGLTYTSQGIAQTILGLPIATQGTVAPYSFHTGGANFVRGDGSVHYISENIDFRSFISLATPSGRKVHTGGLQFRELYPQDSRRMTVRPERATNAPDRLRLSVTTPVQLDESEKDRRGIQNSDLVRAYVDVRILVVILVAGGVWRIATEEFVQGQICKRHSRKSSGTTYAQQPRIPMIKRAKAFDEAK